MIIRNKMVKFMAVLTAALLISSCSGKYKNVHSKSQEISEHRSAAVYADKDGENVEGGNSSATKKREHKNRNDVNDTAKTPKKEKADSDRQKKEETPEETGKNQAEHSYRSPLDKRVGLDPKYLNTLSNEDMSWWYIVPKQKFKGVKAAIKPNIAKLTETYGGIWQVPETGKKTVYLTMDEGYEYKDNTVKILDTLKAKKVPCTFFITGQFIDTHPELVKRMVKEGHTVGNHTVNHLRASKALNKSLDTFVNDITGLEKKFKDLTGRDISPFMRPPEGGYSVRSLAIIQALGYRPVFWSFAYKDWDTKAQPAPNYAKDFILGQVHDGSVMLIHAVSRTNVEILPDLIDKIREAGYEFGYLPE